MKVKLIFIMLAVMMLFAATPAYAGTVAGHVISESTGDGVVGAEVVALCEGTPNTATTSSYANGLYAVELDCPVGNWVTVTATLDGAMGSGRDTMQKVGEGIHEMEIVIIDVTMTPEFGLIAIPLLLSIAGFVFMRGRVM